MDTPSKTKKLFVFLWASLKDFFTFYGRSVRKSPKTTLILTLVVLLVVGYFCRRPCYAYLTGGTEDGATIVSLQTKRVASEARDVYLVFTDNKEYKNEDSGWRLKFRSSSLQRCLEAGKQQGHKFKLTFYGWRIGYLSLYPNLYRAVDLTTGEKCDS